MPIENRISIVISDEDKAAIEAALGTIRTKLEPYLVALTPDERMESLKMRDKSIPFVEKTLNYIVTNPEFAPPDILPRELNKDVSLAVYLNTLEAALKQLLTGVDDTCMLAGSEAFIACLSYYNSVKEAARRNVPNAKAIYDDLKLRFPQRPGKNPPQTPPTE